MPYLLELQLRRLRGWYWQLSATTYHTQLLHGCWPSQRTFRRLHSMQDLFIFTCLSDRIIVYGGVGRREVLEHDMPGGTVSKIPRIQRISPQTKITPYIASCKSLRGLRVAI